MFESFEEAERNRGFKGFLARHFGPVIYIDMAEKEIRKIGGGLMFFAALSGLLGVMMFANPWPLVAGLILGSAAFVLYLTKSRAAALALLGLLLLNALLRVPALVPWGLVLIGARATQLTFGFHRLRKFRAEALSALE